MGRFAIIENNKVKNIVEATIEVAQKKGWINGAYANIGDEWNGASFTPVTPLAIVPRSVTSFQAKAALLQAGLLDDFESLLTSKNTPALATLAWSAATIFNRDSPTLIAMATKGGLTTQQVDDLFVIAESISV